MQKVFEPFFTTKKGSKGSGLGRSQVYGFAHESGGTVTIDSAIGRGTTVTIYLPRAHEDADEAQGESPIEMTSGGTVLVVEDNPEVVEVSASMLKELGYEVHAVADAAAALEAVGRQSFDLVVSDIVMTGGLDGIALARTLRDRNPHLPVLLVTGYSETAAKVAQEFRSSASPSSLRI
jgi:CheY-like chemotaxis protein